MISTFIIQCMKEWNYAFLFVLIGLHFRSTLHLKYHKNHQYITEHFNRCLMHCEHKKPAITFIKMVTMAHYLITWTSLPST